MGTTGPIGDDGDYGGDDDGDDDDGGTKAISGKMSLFSVHVFFAGHRIGTFFSG